MNMKKYIYTLYGSIVVMMLAVIIASAHNIYVGRKTQAAEVVSKPTVDGDSLVQRFSFRPDSIPAMSYVPLQGADYTSLDTVNVAGFDGSTAVGRRAITAHQIAFSIDSLIATHAYGFYPSAMQVAPNGPMRMIYVDYYYLYISPVDLEVHIPIQHSPSGYLTMLNFNSNSISDYKNQKQQSEWVVSFSATTAGSKYDFQLIVSTITAEAELLVASPEVSMRYLGTIGNRKEVRQRRAAEFFQELGRTNPAATN